MKATDQKILDFVDENKSFLSANNIDVSHSLITGDWFVYKYNSEYGYYDYYIQFKTVQQLVNFILNEFKFELTDLEHDISYTGKPCLLFMGNIYDEDGIPFSSTSPTAAITDIVQTGSAEGSFTHYGNNFDYEFYFYVNTEIRGSDNCLEWGVYAPNSVDIYYPKELKDGRVTEYWTAWSNNGSATFSGTPYVILKENGDYKYFETHSYTLYHGGATRSIQNQSFNNIITMRLDSIRYERY